MIPSACMGFEKDAKNNRVAIIHATKDALCASPKITPFDVQ